MNWNKLKSRISAVLPLPLLQSYLKLKRAIKGDPYKGIEILKRTELKNIYHCCPQKTGSQWLKAIFADPVIFQYTGMKTTNFDKYLKLNNFSKEQGSTFPKPFPPNRIITPLYVSEEQFGNIPDKGNYKGFYVMRDPRDVVVSFYFSKRNIHVRTKGTDKIRKDLKSINEEQGMIYIIDHLERINYWKKLRAWADNKDNNIILVKYENLIGENYSAGFKELFNHLNIPLPDKEFNDLLDKYSFKKLTAGRKEGQEDKYSYFRKGISGDWENYFTDEIFSHFNKVTGNLVEKLNY